MLKKIFNSHKTPYPRIEACLKKMRTWMKRHICDRYGRFWRDYKKDRAGHLFEVIGIGLLITLTWYTASINKDLELRKDVDIVLNYSSDLEKSYRMVRNYYEWIEFNYYIDKDVRVNKIHDGIDFEFLMDSLDYNIANFYHKATLTGPPEKKEACNRIADFIGFYWGMYPYEGEYSFREFLKKQYELALVDLPVFMTFQSQRNDILTYFDNLMHLIIVEKSISVRTDSKPDVAAAFKAAGSDIKKMRENISNKKTNIVYTTMQAIELIRSRQLEKIKSYGK